MGKSLGVILTCFCVVIMMLLGAGAVAAKEDKTIDKGLQVLEVTPSVEEVSVSAEGKSNLNLSLPAFLISLLLLSGGLRWYHLTAPDNRSKIVYFEKKIEELVASTVMLDKEAYQELDNLKGQIEQMKYRHRKELDTIDSLFKGNEN